MWFNHFLLHFEIFNLNMSGKYKSPAAGCPIRSIQLSILHLDVFSLFNFSFTFLTSPHHPQVHTHIRVYRFHLFSVHSPTHSVLRYSRSARVHVVFPAIRPQTTSCYWMYSNHRSLSIKSTYRQCGYESVLLGLLLHAVFLHENKAQRKEVFIINSGWIR